MLEAHSRSAAFESQAGSAPALPRAASSIEILRLRLVKHSVAAARLSSRRAVDAHASALHAADQELGELIQFDWLDEIAIEARNSGSLPIGVSAIPCQSDERHCTRPAGV